MHSSVTPLFHKVKVRLCQTTRAVTPFGGLASFIAFLDQIGYAQQVQAHLPWQLSSPNAIPLAHTLTAFCFGVIAGARRFAHTEMTRAAPAQARGRGVCRGGLFGRQWRGGDELSVRKGHQDISVFADLIPKRVRFAAADRDAGVFPRFIEAWEAHNGHRHALTEVALDLSPAYLTGVRETCRNATVVHDQYHVIANLIEATERARRREQKQRPELKAARWRLRQNPEHLGEEQTAGNLRG